MSQRMSGKFNIRDTYRRKAGDGTGRISEAEFIRDLGSYDKPGSGFTVGMKDTFLQYADCTVKETKCAVYIAGTRTEVDAFYKRAVYDGPQLSEPLFF